MGKPLTQETNTMKRIVVIFLILLTPFLIWAGTDHAESKAVQAAKTWLALVDAGAYGQSWEEAAAYFKDAVKKTQWNQSATGVRKPLGAVVSRSLKSATYVTSLPGAPDGKYVVIQFSSSFKNKATATETVTPMLDKDGQWRVSGYYIK
jgi:hypothetical protein